jgi:hypothetical protein
VRVVKLFLKSERDFTYIIKNTQNSIKDQWLKPSQGRQKRKSKERPKDAQPTTHKQEIVPLMVSICN